MRFVFTGGGTGGHVYPALSVAASLMQLAPESQFLYLGTAGGAEARLVTRHGITFRSVHAGQVRGKAPWQSAASAGRILLGVAEARAALEDFHPAAVFATGGYASVPVALAARLAKVPLLVFLPDVRPGWAVRVASHLATRVAASTEAALPFLPRRKSTVTGYPLREEFWWVTRDAARRRLRLGDGPVLLISGASSGSRALNDAVLGALPQLLELCEIVHLTGTTDEQRVRAAGAALPQPLRDRYHVYGYLDDMASAMAAADLAVMRAGASSLAEPAAVGLPAVLVPGPFADQRRNADYLAARGAAIILDQAELPRRFTALIRELIGSPERRDAMRAASRRLARPAAATTLASALLDLGRPDRVAEASLP